MPPLRKVLRFDAHDGTKGKIVFVHYRGVRSADDEEIVFTAIPSDGDARVSILTGDNLTQIVSAIFKQEFMGERRVVSFFELRTSVSHRNMFTQEGHDIIPITVPAMRDFPVRYAIFGPIPYHLPVAEDFADIIRNRMRPPTSDVQTTHTLGVVAECLCVIQSPS